MNINGVNLGQCKRIVQYFWDPEPRNNEEPHASIWCLGKEYTSTAPQPTLGERYNKSGRCAMISTQPHNSAEPLILDKNRSRPHESSPATTGLSDTYGWPEEFLLDFESKIWITYRSNFPPIPKPESQDGTTSKTLTMRLRGQAMDSQGFTTDTGWGCMIRSGQSLLANALSILILGRGIMLSPMLQRPTAIAKCL